MLQNGLNALLFIFNIVTPLFFLHKGDARLILAAGLASLVLTLFLYARFGKSRILALGHIFWVPLVYYLWRTLPDVIGSETYDLWLLSVLMINSIALVFDCIALIRFSLKL
ncbi:MAG: hypothetical protein KDK48_01865 [Chlamydiia bacterium]|nr:hypothetical protein [Chlamydiia bacterium]